MTKSEEKKLVAEIQKVIDFAGEDSYIHDTFAGVCEICLRNIEDDFADYPVKDLEAERKKNEESGKLILRLEHENQALVTHLDEKDEEISKLNHLLESMQKTADEWEQNAHDAGEMYCDLEKEISVQNAEIIRLRAEIVRMRLERMTDAEYAELYEKTEGVEKNA